MLKGAGSQKRTASWLLWMEAGEVHPEARDSDVQERALQAGEVQPELLVVLPLRLLSRAGGEQEAQC